MMPTADAYAAGIALLPLLTASQNVRRLVFRETVLFRHEGTAIPPTVVVGVWG